jgi:hypothetical protein
MPEEEKLSKEKLKMIEADVKQMADQLDKDRAEFDKEKEDFIKRETAFNKKNDIIDAADAFNHMVKLVDEIYTMYVLQHSTPAGLYDSIKLLLDARSKFLPDQK